MKIRNTDNSRYKAQMPVPMPVVPTDGLGWRTIPAPSQEFEQNPPQVPEQVLQEVRYIPQTQGHKAPSGQYIPQMTYGKQYASQRPLQPAQGGRNNPRIMSQVSTGEGTYPLQGYVQKDVPEIAGASYQERSPERSPEAYTGPAGYQVSGASMGQAPVSASYPEMMQTPHQGCAFGAGPEVPVQTNTDVPIMQACPPNIDPSQTPVVPAGGVPQKKEKKKPRALKVAIAIALICLLLAASIAAWWFLTPHKSTRQGAPGQLEGKSDAEIQAELNRTVDEGMFNISIASQVSFPSGTDEGELRIENVPGNRYLMQVEITRDDTGELIYQTDLIEPNFHIQKDTLDVDLEAGTYDCTATFTAFEPDTEEEIGAAAAKMVVTVQS